MSPEIPGKGVVALFNVITSRKHVGRVDPFATPDETTAPGRVVLQAEAERHVIGVHDGWEGDHTPHWWQLDNISALEAAYDPLDPFSANPVLWTHNPPDGQEPPAEKRLEWNLRQCKHFIQTHTSQSEVRYVRSPRWGCTPGTRAVYQLLGLGVGGNGWPVASDTKHLDGVTWASRPRGVKVKVSKAVCRALRAGFSDIMVTFHDWNDETAAHLATYITGIEEAIYAEVGMENM